MTHLYKLPSQATEKAFTCYRKCVCFVSKNYIIFFILHFEKFIFGSGDASAKNVNCSILNFQGCK